MSACRPQLQVKRSCLHWNWHLWTLVISMLRVNIALLPHLPPCVSPRVRTCEEKTRLFHIDWGPLTQTEKNKAFSSLLRCLGKDLLKVVFYRSTVLSGYCSDIARSRGWRGIATEASINNAEERNVLSNCLHTLLCFSLKQWEDREGNSADTGRKWDQILSRDCFVSRI